MDAIGQRAQEMPDSPLCGLPGLKKQRQRIISKEMLILCMISYIAGCAPIEYSVAITGATHALAEADIAGAGCTQEQLDRLSPETENLAPDPGYALATSEDPDVGLYGQPMCDAPFEYYYAKELIQKAREEVSYSDYEPAIELANEAGKKALEARDIARNRAKERGR